MSYTPQPNVVAPICAQCEDEATWDSKFADWWCFACDDGSLLIFANEVVKE
jgi:hypothetical protein